MMLYGTRKEEHALSSYQHLAPQEEVQDMSLALWGTDNAHDWLAASPDGLIKSAGLEGVASTAGVSDEVAAWVKEQTGERVWAVTEGSSRGCFSIMLCCVMLCRLCRRTAVLVTSCFWRNDLLLGCCLVG